MWEYQTLALPFRRRGVKPHSGSTAGFLPVKSCSISIPSGFFFCCNFMFCLIVQSGRCDFHVTFYPSVFLYQKGKQKGPGLLQRDGLIFTDCQKHTAQGAQLTVSSEGSFLAACTVSHFSMFSFAPNRNSLGMTNKEITFVSYRESPCSQQSRASITNVHTPRTYPSWHAVPFQIHPAPCLSLLPTLFSQRY